MNTAGTTMEAGYAEGLARSRADMFRERLFQETLEEDTSIEAIVKSPITGVGWYVILLIALIGDAIGALLDLTIFLSIITTLLGWVIQGVIWFYFYRHGVGFLISRSGKKLAVYVSALVIETIPFINALPMLSISFVVVTLLENTERRHHNSKVWKGIREGLEYAESHRLGL